MSATIGVNLRVTGHNSQGGRKYMEDRFSVAYQQTEDENNLEYAFFGIYDGHGGGEAATYAKEHLMESIVRQKCFWSDKDTDVLRAIKEGYIATHYAMWKEQANWPKTASGLPSTAGTTATIAFIRHAKIYIGHVGDSGIVLGYQVPGEMCWKAKPLTKDHKPENAVEMSRIEQCGGKVITKSGVPRVVWNRPRIGHKGPVRRSTPIDEIPFLAVARSLGDLWSYNSARDEFVVSPDPDTCVIPIDTSSFRCLIFGTDGLWNMISPETAVQIVQTTEYHNERIVFSSNAKNMIWVNPSKRLVEYSLERWASTRLRADNTTAVTLLLDPPGPPRAEVLHNQRQESSDSINTNCNPDQYNRESNMHPAPPYPQNGLTIVTRYSENSKEPDTVPINPPIPETSVPETEQADKQSGDLKNKLGDVSTSKMSPNISYPESSITEANTSLNYDPVTPKGGGAFVPSTPNVLSTSCERAENIQINEVSSSSPEIISESQPASSTVAERRTKRTPCTAVLKTRNRVTIGRCTRSQDTYKHPLIQTEKRLRTTTSTLEMKASLSSNITTALKRNTRAAEKKFDLNAIKNQISNKINLAKPRKRNVLEETSSKRVVSSSLVEGVTFQKEPPHKRSRFQTRLTNATSQMCKLVKSDYQTKKYAYSDGSDQENHCRKTPAASLEQATSRRRTRSRLSRENDHQSLPVASCSKSTQNLRERNVMNTPEVLSTLRLRTNIVKTGRSILSPRQRSVAIDIKCPTSGGTAATTSGVVVAKKVTNKNTWTPTKYTMLTRNRVGKFKK